MAAPAIAQDAGASPPGGAAPPPIVAPAPTDAVPAGSAPPGNAPPGGAPPSASPPAAVRPDAPNGAESTPSASPPPLALPTEPPDAAAEAGKKKKKRGKNHDTPEGTLDAEEADDRAGGRAVPGDPWGEERGGAELGFISLRAMLQARYTTTLSSPSTNVRPDYVVRENYLAQQGDGFSLNRFFLRIAGDPSELIGLKAILDFAKLAEDNAEGTVKQAYAIVKPIPKHLRFVAGLFKLPFSTLELDPIAKYELADLGQADALLKDLGYGGRDLGAEVIVAPFADPDLLHITAGAFRGHTYDENDYVFGTLGARVESEPTKGLRLGIDMVDHLHDVVYQRPFDTKKKHVLPNPPDPFYPTQKDWSAGRAWSADVSFERYHLSARAEVMVGDRVDVDSSYGARTFASVWGLVAYRFRTGPIQLMPALRAEWLDGDREHKIGLRRELSAAMNVILSKNARLLFDVTRTDVEKGSAILDQPTPLQVPPFLELNGTRIVGQLQVEM